MTFETIDDEFGYLANIATVLADEDEAYMLDDGQCPFRVCRAERWMQQPHRQRCPKFMADQWRKQHEGI